MLPRAARTLERDAGVTLGAEESNAFRVHSADGAYLQRVAAGDRAAMRECVERYSRLVWSLAVR